MTEILITSSVLILALTALRYLLRGKISARLQYALWGLAALRLLLPFSLVHSPVSVMNAALAAGETKPVQTVQAIGSYSPPTRSFRSAYAQVVEEYEARGVDVDTLEGSALEALDYEAYDKMRGPTLAELAGRTARMVWLAGIGVMGLCLLGSNLALRRRLTRSARRLEVPGCPVPVYVSQAAPSPCLMGLFRQAVYLTPAGAEDGTRLRHILTHELTHRRHGDPFWSLVRCLCLTLYWFDPLVWLAAALSRRDCELACDEGSLSRLGEGERTAYGRTLLDMVPRRSDPVGLLCTATTMSSGRRGLRERVALIARRPRPLAAALAAAILLAAVAVGCTFTTAQPEESKSSDLPLAERLAALPEALQEKVVRTQEGMIAPQGDGLLASYYFAEDYGGEWGGWICDVARLTPVEFEQEFTGWEMSGGASYLGRDAEYYYVCYSPTDVNFDPAHQEDYQAAEEALADWLEEIFSTQAGMTPVGEDPVFQSFIAACSYEGRHVNVIYHPYYGMSGYGTKQDIARTLLLSQPVTQGEGGIWCVDRWYDENGGVYYAVPAIDMTMAEHYAALQAACDTGERPDLLDPTQVALAYMAQWSGQELSIDAFQAGAVYEGAPQIGAPTPTADQGVEARMSAIRGGEADRVALTLQYGRETRSVTPLSHAGNGLNFSDLTYNHAWTDINEEAYLAGGDLAPADAAYALTVANAAGDAWFRFWPGSDVVLYHDAAGDTWYRTQMLQEDPWSLTDAMRRWFDEAEFDANLAQYAVLTTRSRDFDEVARLWGEALGQAIRMASPGSEYEVRDARCYRAEVYDTVAGDDTQFCFHLEMALDPVEPNGPGFMAGAGLTPIEEGEYAGYWSWGHEVVLRRTGDVWRLVDWGSGGYRLEDYQ